MQTRPLNCGLNCISVNYVNLPPRVSFTKRDPPPLLLLLLLLMLSCDDSLMEGQSLCSKFSATRNNIRRNEKTVNLVPVIHRKTGGNYGKMPLIFIFFFFWCSPTSAIQHPHRTAASGGIPIYCHSTSSSCSTANHLCR